MPARSPASGRAIAHWIPFSQRAWANGLVMAAALLGIAGAWTLTRLLSSALYEVSPSDPATFAAVALVLAASALLACWLPARRAARIDPMSALRCE